MIIVQQVERYRYWTVADITKLKWKLNEDIFTVVCWLLKDAYYMEDGKKKVVVSKFMFNRLSFDNDNDDVVYN